MATKMDFENSADALKMDLKADIKTSADALKMDLKADIKTSADALKMNFKASADAKHILKPVLMRLERILNRILLPASRDLLFNAVLVFFLSIHRDENTLCLK